MGFVKNNKHTLSLMSYDNQIKSNFHSTTILQ